MATQISDPVVGDGIILCPSVLPPEEVTKWKSTVDARYHELEMARRSSDAASITRMIGARERFVPTASSFTVCALNSECNMSELLNSVSIGISGRWMKNILGWRLLCNLDQSWVRR